MLDDVAKIGRTLMLKEPFYGLFLITLNKVIRPDIGTAGVSKNGINSQLAISPKFWGSLTDDYKIGVLKHELLHIMFFHLDYRESYADHYVHNLAADIEINQYIDDKYLPTKEMSQADYEAKYGPIIDAIGEDLISGKITREEYNDRMQKEVPFRGIYIQNYPELNLEPFKGTKYYYDKLQQALKDNTCPALSNQVARQRAGKIIMHDSWDEFGDISEGERDLIRKQINYMLKEIARNHKKSHGLIPGELKEYIDKLFEVKEPVFDWKAYLRRFIGGSNQVYTKKTRKKDSRRFPGNPALKIKTKKRILVAVDTSGSVSDVELAEFFNEIHHIWKVGVQVTVAQCDADIHDVREYKGKFDGRICGRGGTNFQPIIDYYDQRRKEFTTLIFLTDGYCNMPTRPRGSMLWVMSSRSNPLSEFKEWPGHKIKIPGEDKG